MRKIYSHKLIESQLKDVLFFGTFQKTDDGFCYIKISNDLLDGVYAIVDRDYGDLEKPPYFSHNVDKIKRKLNPIETHISVISNDEFTDNNLNVDKYIGNTVKFKIVGAKFTTPDGWEEMDKVFFIEVESEDIANIRKELKLPKTYKDKGHNFHITFAVIKK